MHAMTAEHALVPAGTQREEFGSIDGAIVDIDIPITVKWKADAIARLKAMGRDQWELAEHVRCSQPNISQTLSGKSRKQLRSKFAHAISLAIGLPLPGEAVAMLAHYFGMKNQGEAYETMMRGLAIGYGIRLIKPDE